MPYINYISIKLEQKRGRKRKETKKRKGKKEREGRPYMDKADKS